MRSPIVTREVFRQATPPVAGASRWRGAPHLRGSRASGDSEFGLRCRRRVVQAVGLQPAHQFVRPADRGQMAAIDHVSLDAESFASQPAHELEREEAIVAAGKHPRVATARDSVEAVDRTQTPAAGFGSKSGLKRRFVV
jgi:hypothetical protein